MVVTVLAVVVACPCRGSARNDPRAVELSAEKTAHVLFLFSWTSDGRHDRADEVVGAVGHGSHGLVVQQSGRLPSRVTFPTAQSIEARLRCGPFFAEQHQVVHHQAALAC